MKYFDAQLFLGFVVDDEFSRVMSSLNPELLKLYIQDNDSCLQEVMYHDLRYLGKFAGKGSHLSDLDLLETNIYSLLKQIVPHYPYGETALVLFPIAEESTKESTNE